MYRRIRDFNRVVINLSSKTLQTDLVYIFDRRMRFILTLVNCLLSGVIIDPLCVAIHLEILTGNNLILGISQWEH
jgi:hypothetical protein